MLEYLIIIIGLLNILIGKEWNKYLEGKIFGYFSITLAN